MGCSQDAAPGLALETGHRPQGQPRTTYKLLQHGSTHLPHLQNPSSPCLLGQTLCFGHALGQDVPARCCASTPELPATSSHHLGSARPLSPGYQLLPNTAHMCPWPRGPPGATGNHHEPLGATTARQSHQPGALAVSTRCPGPGLVISLIAHRRAA